MPKFDGDGTNPSTNEIDSFFSWVTDVDIDLTSFLSGEQVLLSPVFRGDDVNPEAVKVTSLPTHEREDG